MRQITIVRQGGLRFVRDEFGYHRFQTKVAGAWVNICDITDESDYRKLVGRCEEMMGRYASRKEKP